MWRWPCAWLCMPIGPKLERTRNPSGAMLLTHSHCHPPYGAEVSPEIGLGFVRFWDREQHHLRPAEDIVEDHDIVVLVAHRGRLAPGDDLAKNTVAVQHERSIFPAAAHAPRQHRQAEGAAILPPGRRDDRRPTLRRLRYAPAVIGDWGGVLGPPYDVINTATREALRAKSPHQITHVETASGAEGIAAAAATLRRWAAEGALQHDTAPAFYLSEHIFTHAGVEQTRLALYAVVQLTPWGKRRRAPPRRDHVRS